MKKRFVLLAALALPAGLTSVSASAQQPPEWHKGDRVAPEYRDRQYVIDDWREYRLKAPPRGFHWVGVGGQYYLVRNSNWAVERVGP
jgi:Ni/Co efflux regulator RcnB|nr:RcnB family protein [Paraburkholderia ferrariae]